MDTGARFRAAREAGVRRIVYLGGLGEGDRLSRHLASRQQVGRILRNSGVPTTVRTTNTATAPFNEVTAILNPRVIRFGFRYNF